MKRLLCFSLVLLLSIAMICPAFAADDTFVPSISYKDYPQIVIGEDDVIGVVRDQETGEILDNIYAGCLVITPLSKVHTSTEIPEPARQMLLHVYEKLSDGSMQIPAEKLEAGLEPDEVTVRELFDLSWLCEDHPEMVAPQGVVFEVTLRVNVDEDQQVYAMTYKNDQWNPIVNVVNNGNGTVTCTFEDLCPVAFIVGADKDVPPAGDMFNVEAFGWLALMVGAAVTLTFVLFQRRKENER